MAEQAGGGARAARGQGVDPRTISTDRKILAAVLSILTRQGPDRLTIEAVSAQSGVAKTSIYRRYANSDDMVDDALARSKEHLAPPPIALPQGWGAQEWTRELDAAVRELVRSLGTGVAMTLLGQPRSETAEILRRHLLRPRMENLRTLLQLQADVGALRAPEDLDVLVDFILGSAYARMARDGALPEDWADQVRQALLEPITQTALRP